MQQIRTLGCTMSCHLLKMAMTALDISTTRWHYTALHYLCLDESVLHSVLLMDLSLLNSTPCGQAGYYK